MNSVVFSLGSEREAYDADQELLRSGVEPSRIHYLDRFSYIPAANDSDMTQADTSIPAELDRELAAGRVLLEVEVEDDNRAAVERLLVRLGPDVRKFITHHPIG